MSVLLFFSAAGDASVLDAESDITTTTTGDLTMDETLAGQSDVTITVTGDLDIGTVVGFVVGSISIA